MVTNPRIVCVDLLVDCQGRVRRSIVDNDHLDVLIAVVQYGPHSSSNESFTIANWNNNADQVIDITTLLRGIPTCIFFAGVRVGDIDGALFVSHGDRSRTDRFRRSSAASLGAYRFVQAILDIVIGPGADGL